MQVQRGSATIATDATTLEVTLTTPVPVGKSFALVTHKVTQTSFGRTHITAELTDESGGNYRKLKLERAQTSGEAPCEWQVISGNEFTVQTGATSVSSSTVDVTISAVTRSRAFVVMNSRVATGYPRNLSVKAWLTSDTNLRLARAGTSTPVVRWYVVEWSGATVQQIEWAIASGSASVSKTIDSVDRAHAFLIHNWLANVGTTTTGSNCMARAHFTSATAVEVRRGTTSSNDLDGVVFVIAHPAIDVQYGTDSVASATTITKAISAVDLDLSFVAANYWGNSYTNADVSAGLSNGQASQQLSDDDELTIVRNGTDSTLYAAWFVVTGALLEVSEPLPANGTKFGRTGVGLSAMYSHPGGDAGTLRFQADTVNTFDSGAFVEDTAAVTNLTRGAVTLTLPARGTWYWRVRGESGSVVGDWLTPTLTVERVSCEAELITPVSAADCTVTPQPFVAAAYSDDSTQLLVRLQLDTVATFDGPDLVELTSDPAESGEEHTLTHALLGTQTWYWRARAERDDIGGAVSDWTASRTLNVDTGGAVPASILPDPTGVTVALPEDFMLDWSAALSHVLTPTAAATLRLQVQKDTTSGFLAPETATSGRVKGGQRATATVSVTSPGTYWFRFRTLADYGDTSAWVTYEVVVTAISPFVGDVQWIPQVGPRSNRVFVRIAGTATLKTAELGGVSADAKVDHWVEVPAGTSEAEAQNAANDILAVRQARPASIAGPVSLTVAASFDRKVVAQWWDEDPVTGARVLLEEHTLALAKKVHDIDRAITTLYLGDYLPPPEELQARILAKLMRP